MFLSNRFSKSISVDSRKLEGTAGWNSYRLNQNWIQRLKLLQTESKLNTKLLCVQKAPTTKLTEQLYWANRLYASLVFGEVNALLCSFILSHFMRHSLAGKLLKRKRANSSDSVTNEMCAEKKKNCFQKV